ncbi:MAG: hypothetical protein KC476_08695 [Cyanobacteria bacterium HKST-UBA06]|nr:hypothetical protein [Cyanobacteria bacterium HKST-UBA06]
MVSPIPNALARQASHSMMQDFAHASAINKGILDIIGIDVPLIAVAKNNLERKERAFQQAITFLIFFMLAPLHATLLGRVFRKNLADPRLMRLSFDALTDATKGGFAKGVKQFYARSYGQAVPAKIAQLLSGKGGKGGEALRKNIIRQKTNLMWSDILVESILVSLIGPAKVAFGRWMTGKKGQFTGEMGLVKEATLDQIYAQEAQKTNKNDQFFKTILPMLVGLGLTTGLTSLIRHQFITKSLKVPGKTGAMATFTKILAKLTDYRYMESSPRLKNVPLMADGGMMILNICQDLGYLAAARSPREFREILIQRGVLEVAFWGSMPALMWASSRALAGRWGVKPGPTIYEVLRKSRIPRRLVPTVKRYLGKQYLIGFAATTAILSYVIHLTNEMTKDAVKQKAAEVEGHRPGQPLYDNGQPTTPSRQPIRGAY